MSDGVNHKEPLQMLPLDPLTFPLYGPSLIEASAGTGKTYTIVNLYLRLLLGRGCAPLGVEKILVVTFTNAATGELKERIRQRLREAYLAFFAEFSDDPFIQRLIEQSDSIELDCQRLALASKQMDEAAVYTIHGFCHKALTEHAFESGAMYEQSFILDESQWLQMAAEDYWRKHIITLEPAPLELLLKHWATPQSLLSDIARLLSQHATAYQTQSIESAINSANEYAHAVAKVKSWWLSNEVSEQLSKAKLNGRAKISKLPLLQNMQAFCKANALEIDFDKSGWEMFSPEQIEKAAKKGSADLSHLDFSQFELLQSMLKNAQESLVLAFSQDALDVVSANLASHKARLHLLSPDDLLAGLQQALNQQATEAKRNAQENNDQLHHSKASITANSLASTIRENFPAALIDEFQDTDPVQFEVFQGIYGAEPKNSLENKQKAPCWIMIGDPKQAIYGFRGADIFTYIRAKEWVVKERHFTLATNWRSAPKLVDAINLLFESSRKGFLFEHSIPFNPVAAGREFAGLTVQGETLACLEFLHLCSNNGLPISANDAAEKLAIATANQIANWLHLAEAGEAYLKGKAITAADCCVLVRNRREALVMKQALSAVNVASVFLSRTSVFSTQVAIDLLRLLKALSQPTDERLLKTALLSELFTLNAQQLDELFNDESRWQDVLEQRFYWHQIWQKQGVIKAVNQVLHYFDVEQGLIKHFNDGLRRITDLRHLTELLQQQSMQLVGEAQLIHWFETCLLEPDHNVETQQMRLESDANLVQIITLHSSKGLEFPLVFIPFASSYKNAQEALYHNDAQSLEVDFLTKEQNLQKADFERLAEDIRLFYVAITRAIYYCSVGVWNITLGRSKKDSGFIQSALGCLLMSSNDDLDDGQPQNKVTDQDIATRVEVLTQRADISYKAVTEVTSVVPQRRSAEGRALQSPMLKALTLNKPINRAWRLTSYSAISSQQVHLDMPAPGQDEGQDKGQDYDSFVEDEMLNTADNLSEQSSEPEQSPFSFERGANAGSFLHGVLENIDLQQPAQLPEAISKQSIKFGIKEEWQACLETWLSDVLLTSFSSENPNATGSDAKAINLSQLAPKQVKVEMEFHMPLHQVKVKDFNHIINHYSQHHTRDYQFEELNGMIKGFIDLMFEFDGKFYVADYKSNHLGDHFDDYHQGAMEHAMTDHDYHLQAILYTLALHRWLSYKLPNYEYSTHIGGAYYLFLRGMSQTVPGNGVYFVLPEQSMIEQLDTLFAGGTDSSESIANSSANSSSKNTTEFADNSLENPQQQGQLDLW
ncbi:UvrD-helicase domain-containing protein [Paraglaciecola sp.]|uniref:UvrD-helicase domain-containing protein n=1 Tax=Paraglaciecola sp. TaxID=1920173 RepID=UPI003267C7AB